MNIIYALCAALLLAGVAGFSNVAPIDGRVRFAVQLAFFAMLSLLVIALSRDDNTGGQ